MTNLEYAGIRQALDIGQFDKDKYSPESLAALEAALEDIDGIEIPDDLADAVTAALEYTAPPPAVVTFSCPVKSMAAKVGKPVKVPVVYNGPGSLGYASSNTSVCTITPEGQLMLYKAGVAVITVTAPDGAKIVFAVTVTA